MGSTSTFFTSLFESSKTMYETVLDNERVQDIRNFVQNKRQQMASAEESAIATAQETTPSVLGIWYCKNANWPSIVVFPYARENESEIRDIIYLEYQVPVHTYSEYVIIKYVIK